MDINFLTQEILKKNSFLCVGLDTDGAKIPQHFLQKSNPIVSFNKAIIDATKDYCVSYKLNTAFYEALGVKGWQALEETLAYIPNTHFKIADAKRGDIGNTSSHYAKAFFETLAFDAVTVAPYMGEDSVRPFLEYENKVTIVLGLTSNKGAEDFELQKIGNQFLYEKVIETIAKWGTCNNLMFVVGATQATELLNIRRIAPDNFLLIPGIGFQGGSLHDVAKYGMNKNIGLLVNASRAIIYAGKGENFADEAKQIAMQYQLEMKEYMQDYSSK